MTRPPTMRPSRNRTRPALRNVQPLFVDLATRLSDFAHGPRPEAVPRSEPVQQPDQLQPTPSEELPAEQTAAIRELVVISGKGGTGKTSVVASFFALARGAVAADCDVDAADLHLVLDPTVRERWPFSGGDEARIDPDACTGCGLCVLHCRFDAIRQKQDGAAAITFLLKAGTFPRTIRPLLKPVGRAVSRAGRRLRSPNGLLPKNSTPWPASRRWKSPKPMPRPICWGGGSELYHRSSPSNHRGTAGSDMGHDHQRGR